MVIPGKLTGRLRAKRQFSANPGGKREASEERDYVPKGMSGQAGW